MSKLIRLADATTQTLGPEEGVAALHVACATLVRAHPDVIRSLSLTIPLADFPVPATAVVDLSARIADEYGLVATGELSEPWLVVRLVRVKRPDPAKRCR
jgi:hypothetical protein